MLYLCILFLQFECVMKRPKKRNVQTKAMFPVNVYFYAQFVRELQTAVKLLEPGMVWYGIGTMYMGKTMQICGKYLCVICHNFPTDPFALLLNI